MVKLNPDYTVATKRDRFQRGYDQPVPKLAHANRIDPKYALAFVGHGMAELAKGSVDHAIASFTQAIKIDPNHGPAYYNRANAHYQKRAYNQANQDLGMAIKLGTDKDGSMAKSDATAAVSPESARMTDQKGSAAAVGRVPMVNAGAGKPNAIPAPAVTDKKAPAGSDRRLPMPPVFR